jgi:tRNA(Ile)-lysidine synthase
MADIRRAVREGFALAGLVPGDLVLVACSGGADSLALAAATAFEGPRAELRVGAIVVEHGLQEITVQVAEKTAILLGELGLDPVRVVSVKVGSDGGTEAAARTARYEALEAQARELGAKAVLLGHTRNDQAETVLLGLARGSGLRSIAGMTVVSPSEVAGLVWLRPLLDISRETTEAFCRDSGLAFWVDPHNSDPAFKRVRVRDQALPMLEEAVGDGVVESLARTASLAQEDLAYLEAESDATYERLVKAGSTGLTVAVGALAGLPKAIGSRVIHRCISVIGAAPGKTHVDQVYELVLNWHGQKELTLPGVRVVRQGDAITFKSSKTLRPGAC